MNHYPHHIGDYIKSTAYLTNEEDLCYRRLIELYYDTEKPIGLDIDLTARRVRSEPFTVLKILTEYFTETKAGYKNKRCDLEIRQYHLKVKANRINGKLGGRPKKTQSVSKTQSVNLANPTITQNNLNQNQNQNQNQNHNHKPEPIKQEVASLPDWLPVDSWIGFCEMRRKSKSAFTERAKTLLIARLLELKDSGQDVSKVLDQSTENGWKSVYPLKVNGSNGNGKFNPVAYVNGELAKALDASFTQEAFSDVRREVQPLLSRPSDD